MPSPLLGVVGLGGLEALRVVVDRDDPSLIDDLVKRAAQR
jgi:hypothetical protein